MPSQNAAIATVLGEREEAMGVTISISRYRGIRAIALRHVVTPMLLRWQSCGRQHTKWLRPAGECGGASQKCTALDLRGQWCNQTPFHSTKPSDSTDTRS